MALSWILCPLWGTIIHGHHQKNSVEKGRRIFLKGIRGRHARQKKNKTQQLAYPSDTKRPREGKVLRAGLKVSQRQKEGREMKSFRSQGDVVRKERMVSKNK